MVDRRRVMAVLKWVSLEDILSHISTVSRLWVEASHNDEVWIRICHDYGTSPYKSENQSVKEGFYREIAMLPLLSKHSLKTFHCVSKSVVSETALVPKRDYDNDEVAVLLPTGELITCGGQGRHQANYITLSGSIQRLQNMRHERKLHSVALLSQVLYVLGGDNYSNRSAEKLWIAPLDTITDRQWEVLPDSLLPHFACQPCVHRTLIYLCGGNTEKSEAFDTAREEYSLLPFTLPNGYLDCVSFFRCGELIIFIGDTVCRWRPGSKLRSKRLKGMPFFFGLWSNTKQVLIGNSLFRLGDYHVAEIDIVTEKCRIIYSFD